MNNIENNALTIKQLQSKILQYENNIEDGIRNINNCDALIKMKEDSLKRHEKSMKQTPNKQEYIKEIEAINKKLYDIHQDKEKQQVNLRQDRVQINELKGTLINKKTEELKAMISDKNITSYKIETKLEGLVNEQKNYDKEAKIN